MADLPESTGSLAAYMRVSSEGQKAQGTIENQRSTLDRYLAAHGLTPYGWYQDEAWSGYFVPFPARPDAARLLADIRAGHVGIVLVTKLDRFGGNAREILNAVHELETLGARLISIKENVDTRTSAGRFFLTVLAGVAELERDMIMERTEEGTANRLLETTWMGGRPPIGYAVEGKKATARLVPAETADPASGYSEADVVRLAWVLVTEQDWTCDDVADRLVALGIPTRDGAERWTGNVIYQMLTNPVYKGERPYRRANGTVIVQPVPALVTVEQWDRAQAVLAAHRRGSTRNPDRPYLLRALMRCAQCGAPYITSWARSHGGTGPLWRYYSCQTRHYYAQILRRKGSAPAKCPAATVNADKIEAMIWADVEQFARNPGETLLELSARSGEEAVTADIHRAALAELQQQLDAQQAERDSVLVLFRKGCIGERDLDRQLDDIARQEADIKEKRDSSMAALADATTRQDRLQGARERLQQMHAILDDPQRPVTPAVQRTMVEDLVRSIRVETVEVGVSARGRIKREPRVTVRYTFERPAAGGAGGAEPTGMPVQYVDAMLSARR
jgi:site-specific DNA recombinase